MKKFIMVSEDLNKVVAMESNREYNEIFIIEEFKLLDILDYNLYIFQIKQI